MLRNLFSKNISTKLLKFLFIFLILVSFNSILNIQKANARIEVKPSGTTPSIDADVLYKAGAVDNLDITKWTSDKDHGTDPLPDQQDQIVRKDLSEIKQFQVNESPLFIDPFINAIKKRPDLPFYINIIPTDATDTPSGYESVAGYETQTYGTSTDKDGNYIGEIPLPTANATEQANIDNILNSTSTKDLLFVFDWTKKIYPDVYDVAFNSVANSDKLFFLSQDFQTKVARPLEIKMLTYYLRNLKDHLKDQNSDIDKMNKQRIDSLVVQLGAWSSASSPFTMDANGVQYWWDWSENKFGNSSWDPQKFFPPVPWDNVEKSGNDAVINDPNLTKVNKTPVDSSCTATNLQSVMTGDSSCSVVAYLINSMLVGLGQIAGTVLGWAGSLFNWVFNFSVMNFNSWVTKSGAIDIYKTIILAFITSLMLPLVFYLIIKMLIDDDPGEVEKLLPKILLTALFIYFSFGIAGWIIDQSNIITIYIYKAISHTADASNLGEGLKRSMNISAIADKVATASWSAVPYTFINLIILLTGIFVIFQATIIFFARSLVFLLCLIFSPIMVLPDGIPGPIGKFITEQRTNLMTYYTNNLLLAPIFMFLMMVAIKISEQAKNIVAITSTSSLDTTSTGGSATFLGGAIAQIITIAVMMLAINVAKNMSGEVGGKIAASVSGLAGGAITGAGNVIKKRMSNFRREKSKPKENEGANPWMEEEKGKRKTTPLLNTVAGQTGANTSAAQMQKQNTLNSFTAGMTKLRSQSTNQSPNRGAPAPDTKTRSLAGYQAVKNQRNKMESAKDSVGQRAAINQRNVGNQQKVDNDRIQRKLQENKDKLNKDQNKGNKGDDKNKNKVKPTDLTSNKLTAGFGKGNNKGGNVASNTNTSGSNTATSTPVSTFSNPNTTATYQSGVTPKVSTNNTELTSSSTSNNTNEVKQSGSTSTGQQKSTQDQVNKNNDVINNLKNAGK